VPGGGESEIWWGEKGVPEAEAGAKTGVGESG